MIEQLLERGVSALLLDRKGDLARYASEAWWRDPAAPDEEVDGAARANRDRVCTPGNNAVHPLRLPTILTLVDTSA